MPRILILEFVFATVLIGRVPDTAGEQSTRYLFVDPLLRRTNRIETADVENGRPLMVFEELRNITVGPQAASLFEAPR